MSKRVSVIIPSRNDHARLAMCLDALARQTLPTKHREIIVADNGSDPSLEAMASEHDVRYVFQPEGGSYAARNAAIAIATGDILAFTDSDCLPAEDWLERGLAAFAEHGRASSPDLVAGRVEVFAQRHDAPSAAELYELLFAFPQKAYVEHDSFGVTANLLVRRGVIETTGLFNDKLHSGGDREFGRRATAHGFGLVYEPTCIVRHPARYSIDQLFRKSDRVIGGLADSELAGPQGAAEARRRAKRAMKLPLGQWHQILRQCPTYGVRTCLNTCLLIARLRLRTVTAYSKLARSLDAGQNFTPPPPPPPARSAG